MIFNTHRVSYLLCAMTNIDFNSKLTTMVNDHAIVISYNSV